jgi:hypothetical protein
MPKQTTDTKKREQKQTNQNQKASSQKVANRFEKAKTARYGYFYIQKIDLGDVYPKN